jgi:hypothetical protein
VTSPPAGDDGDGSILTTSISESASAWRMTRGRGSIGSSPDEVQIGALRSAKENHFP